ncbi:MAG: YSC84-related protein [Phascolarctobacterium sp.]|nr:YSC84-related protein [Phascolarctobacterium sp.]
MSFKKILVLCLMFVTLCVGVCSAASVEQKKANVRIKVATVLDQLYTLHPEARNVVSNSLGYAVFANTGLSYGIISDNHGRGLAKNNNTGEEIFMKMNKAKLGLGLGAKEYSVVFIFETDDAWNKFTTTKWTSTASASADATDGVNGNYKGSAKAVADGIYIYEFTTKGLIAEVGIGGVTYYRDKKLNK